MGWPSPPSKVERINWGNERAEVVSQDEWWWWAVLTGRRSAVVVVFDGRRKAGGSKRLGRCPAVRGGTQHDGWLDRTVGPKVSRQQQKVKNLKLLSEGGGLTKVGCMHQRASVFVIQLLWAVLAMIPACGLVAPLLVCNGRGLEGRRDCVAVEKGERPPTTRDARVLASAAGHSQCLPVPHSFKDGSTGMKQGIESVSPK